VIKTLVDQFMYPRLGAGQLYEKMERIVSGKGGEVLKRAEVLRIRRDGFRVVSLEYRHEGGAVQTVTGDYFLSSAPLTELITQLDPPPPSDVIAAAQSLRYRHHIGVKLVVEGPAPFPDNWIYVHSGDVKMARISDYLNFSPDMSRASDRHPLTVEYFCFPGDEIWESSDEKLIERAITELEKMGLTIARISGSFVVRSEKAYPVIEIGYQEKIDVIKAYLNRFENLLPIGRSGMFKYNNQDHAMATGLYAARTALGKGRFDPWLVNVDGVYHEGATAA
jgi:protoporphyrinogen oxidase